MSVVKVAASAFISPADEQMEVCGGTKPPAALVRGTHFFLSLIEHDYIVVLPP